MPRACWRGLPSPRLSAKLARVSDQSLLLLGYFARIQTVIELLVQIRVRATPDIKEGIGSAYFEQMTDATRKRWLKALATSEVDAELGARLESVYSDVADVRNHIAHAPLNIHPSENPNPDDIKVGSARWIGQPAPTDEQIESAYTRLLWIEQWLLWLMTQQEKVKPFQKREGEWRDFEPERPPLKAPSK